MAPYSSQCSYLFLSIDHYFSGGCFGQKIVGFFFLMQKISFYMVLQMFKAGWKNKLFVKGKHSGLWNNYIQPSLCRMYLHFIVPALNKYLGLSSTSNLFWVRFHLIQYILNSKILYKKIICYTVKSCSTKADYKARTEKLQMTLANQMPSCLLNKSLCVTVKFRPSVDKSGSSDCRCIFRFLSFLSHCRVVSTVLYHCTSL